MFSIFRLLSAVSLAYLAAAIPAPTVITTTTHSTVTSCSCTSKSTSAGHTYTLTLKGTSSCSKRTIKPTCTTTVSTINTIITTTISTPSSTPVKNSGKRGLAYNDPTLTKPFSLSGQNSKVSWAYNWYSYPYTTGQTQSGYNPALSFVPMLWSTADVLTSVWSSNVAASKAKYGTTAVIAFNEPDGCGGGQACMSISSAVSGYQTWMNPLAGSVQLGAPAVTNGIGTGIGLDYLATFIKNCAGCHIDFVPIHWYGDASQTGDFETYITQAYTAGGNRPLWVTEFGTTSGSAQPFLQSVQSWMDGSGMVAKYAWFMDAPGNLINSNGVGMSALGAAYNSG